MCYCYTMERITLAVADLIPGDTLIPEGFVVNGYPYGSPTLPGTIVPLDENGINFGRHFYDSEAQVKILR